MNVSDESLKSLHEMFNNDEPLHPDLEPYVTENGPLGRALYHPLVHEPIFTHTSLANRLYLGKRKALDAAIASGDWHAVVFLHERPYRLDALWQNADELPDSEFWSLAASVWIDSENIWQHDRLWRAIFRQPRPSHEAFMDPEDREAFDALPETLTVARGCIVGLNEHGLSWTTDAETAKWFANRFADHKGTPTVRMRTIQKSEVFAYLGGRGESEIILRP